MILAEHLSMISVHAYWENGVTENILEHTYVQVVFVLSFAMDGIPS